MEIMAHLVQEKVLYLWTKFGAPAMNSASWTVATMTSIITIAITMRMLEYDATLMVRQPYTEAI